MTDKTNDFASGGWGDVPSNSPGERGDSTPKDDGAFSKVATTAVKGNADESTSYYGQSGKAGK